MRGEIGDSETEGEKKEECGRGGLGEEEVNPGSTTHGLTAGDGESEMSETTSTQPHTPPATVESTSPIQLVYIII